jgi:hypothetical protein
MKTNKIYVGTNGAALSFSSGAKGVAVYPAQKGDKKSYVLLSNGAITSFKEKRINGVGIARYLADNNFVLAQPGDAPAEKLADAMDREEGRALVGSASVDQAQALQAKYAGQICTFVPFDADKPLRTETVKHRDGGVRWAADLQAGFNIGVVETEYVPGRGTMDASLGEGWLVGPDEDASLLPRNTEYGGLIERAVFIICNSGLGTLTGAQNLEMNAAATKDATYPRGKLELALTSGDRLVVGSTGGDELGATYYRDGVVLYERIGMTEPRLGDVLADIMAVVVRVKDMDEAQTKKTRKKAA